MPKGQFKPVFKDYNQHQMVLLPPCIGDRIAANHPVRVIDSVIESLDLTILLSEYNGGGNSSYHPRMLLKVLVYAYINNIYSSRKIEEACALALPFMWLCASQMPDHNTINRFRSDRLKNVLRKVFNQVVELLAEEGRLSLEDGYTDGTKIEANASRYSFVWAKSVKTNKEKIAAQLEFLWNYSQSVAEAEKEAVEPLDLKAISPEKVKAAVEKIEANLKGKPNTPKKIKAKLANGKKNWAKAVAKYNTQEEILAGRNSYSKTDPDATFMRMKDDHLNNGQLKAAYNIQLTTNNQFITNYSVHQDANDFNPFIPHLEQFEQDYDCMPKRLTADAGYGSEQNYEFLEKAGVEAFVKYGSFEKDQKQSSINKKPFIADRLFYNKEEDYYVCPMGQKMQNVGTYKQTTALGFEQTIVSYQAQNCEGCPLRGGCFKAQGNRVIDINHNLYRLKEIAKEKLNSEMGITHRMQRSIDVEPVFGNIKENHNFRRFKLRGKKKVEIEVGLLAIAQNLRKRAA